MRRLLFANVWLILASAPALAAAEGGSSSGFLMQWLNFAILIGALVYFGRKPIGAFFQDRRDAIMTQLSNAASLHKEAEEKYARWQRQLVDLEKEVEKVRSNTRARAEREGNQILADAEASADRIKRDAIATIEQELRRAQARLRSETSDLAVELATGILRDRVTEEDRGRLLDEFIARIEQAPGPGANGSTS